MTTFSDSDEITGNELETVQSTDEEETGADELAGELLAMEEDEIAEKMEGIEDEIGTLKEEEEVAMAGEMKKIENELDKEEEMLEEAKNDLEDDVAGFVGV